MNITQNQWLLDEVWRLGASYLGPFVWYINVLTVCLKGFYTQPIQQPTHSLSTLSLPIQLTHCQNTPKKALINESMDKKTSSFPPKGWVIHFQRSLQLSGDIVRIAVRITETSVPKGGCILLKPSHLPKIIPPKFNIAPER